MSQRGERPKAHGVAWGLRKTGGVMMRGRVELGSCEGLAVVSRSSYRFMDGSFGVRVQIYPYGLMWIWTVSSRVGARWIGHMKLK